MLQGRRPAALNIATLHKVEASPASSHRDHSPGLPMRRRRTKLEKSTKTNEELIQQSHEMLMHYVDTIDHQVRQLMDNHEAQFLVAYRKHSATVKEEMKEIKRQMLQNANNEQQFLDRIRFLEKELIIFRDETLKMSEKLIAKNQEIENLKIKLKEVTSENRQQRAEITELTKTGMTLSARLQIQDRSNSNDSHIIEDKLGSFTKKLGSDEFKYLDQSSPLTLHLKSYTAQLRTRSIKRPQKVATSKLISSAIEEKQNETITPKSIEVNLSAHEKIDSIKTDLSNERKKSSSFKARFERSRVMETEIEKLKSKSFAEKNQYEKIFIDCVEEVRKNIMRKEFAESLNYFKENGPKSLIQFKKMDYFVLLELFFKKEAVAKRLYELIFEPKSE